MLETITLDNIYGAMLVHGGSVYFHDQFGQVMHAVLRDDQDKYPEMLIEMGPGQDYDPDRIAQGVEVGDNDIILERWSDETQDYILNHVSFTDEGEPILDDWYNWAPY